MLLRAALLLLVTGGVAHAGPWPAETTGTFISVTEEFASPDRRGTTSIFIESGGSARFTVGVDSELGAADDDWSAYAFIRQPLSSPNARDRIAISAGLGAQQTVSGSEPLIVLGGAWGRDVENGIPGWLSLEGSARYGTTSGETELAGGATVAVRPVDRIALVNEFRITGIAGSATDPERQLTSSIVGTISQRTRVELGATVDISGSTAPGIRLGTWLEF